MAGAAVSLSRRDVLRSLALGAAAPTLLSACSSTGTGATTDVLVAASLEQLMRAAIDQLEDQRATGRIRLDAASSTTLATQIIEGRDVDLLATADATSMATARTSGHLAEPMVLATNPLVVVTHTGQGAVRSLPGLAADHVTVSLCDASVPCGRLANRLLWELDMDEVAASSVREVDVRGVVARVSSGEADAGIVYATDLAAADGTLVGVATPPGILVAGEVVVALARDASADARALIMLLRGSTGRRLLVDLGFEPT